MIRMNSTATAQRSISSRDLLTGMIVLASLCSTYYREDIPSAVTGSGRFAVYGTDIVGILALGGVATALLLRPNRRSRPLLQYLVVLGAFLAYCAVVSGVRILGGGSDLSSLLIPRANLMAVWVLLLILVLDIRRRVLLLAVSAFSTVLSVLAFSMSMTWATYTFSYWQSNAIRTDVLALLFPLHALAAVTFHRSRWRWLIRLSLGLHLFVLTYCAIISGARLNALLVPLVVLASLVIFARGASIRVVLPYVLVPVLALPLLFVAQGCSEVVKYGVTRSPGFSAILDNGRQPGHDDCFLNSPSETRAASTSAAVPHDAGSPAAHEATNPTMPAPTPTPTPAPTAIAPDPTALDPTSSKQESTQVRKTVWTEAINDIRSGPYFGPGFRQYQVYYSTTDAHPVVLGPHNFVLELALAYGIIGLLMWLSVMTAPLLQAWRRGPRDSATSALTVTALGFAFTTALFEPLMVNPTILVFCFFAIGVFVARDTPTIPLAEVPNR